MSKSKANTVVVGQTTLVDADRMGEIAGFTGQYMNRMAAAGKVPWHGVRNGVRIYRRYDPAEVLAALAHGVKAPDPESDQKKPIAQTKELRVKAG